jgi:hypothetical protein
MCSTATLQVVSPHNSQDQMDAQTNGTGGKADCNTGAGAGAGNGDADEVTAVVGAVARVSDVEELLGECVCGTFNVLLAMTNENEVGCRNFGAKEALQHVTRLAFEHAEKFTAHRHDVLSLGIAVLINLTEHNDGNRM